jgi:glycosyltransferase involved in cell wall biosynthesis
MKQALVIHPELSFYAGGEYLCLTLCGALQELGYRVTLASHSFNPAEFERIYAQGKIMERCVWTVIPRFKGRIPHFQVLQRLDYSRRVWRMFNDTDASIIFSTQSSPFIVPKRMFHFVYSAGDLFRYPHAAAPVDDPESGRIIEDIYITAMRRIKTLLWNKVPSNDWFFAMGSRVLHDIRRAGYSNSSLVFPPVRQSFRPRFPKRKQVLQAARMIPDKRLDLFIDIASRLPQYKFFLVGKRDRLLDRRFLGYSKRILSQLPRNVAYLDGLLSEQARLLEESMVYLYTGMEPGIGIALIEAISAGCIPFSPKCVGATDVLDRLKVGETFEDAEDAATKIKRVLDQSFDLEYYSAIAMRARNLSPEAFRSWVHSITRLKPESTVPAFPSNLEPNDLA